MLSNSVAGQIVPAPDARLNYTQIMFEHDRVKGASEYLIEVIRQDENDSTFMHPAFSQRDSSTATMISNFEFDKKYLWRYTGLDKGKELGWHGPYNFEISNNIHANRNFYRARVIHNDSSANAGGLIIMDISRSIVDRNGNCVWYMPRDTEEAGVHVAPNLPGIMIDDLRISPFGTITYLIAGRAEERALNGKLLWQGPLEDPSSDSLHPGRSTHFHHCFERLRSGNYMVLDRDSVAIRTDTGYVYVEDEIIREFDKDKKQVWRWGSEYYLDSADMQKIIRGKRDSGLLDPTPGGHLNAFYADEENGYIYAGFRNISRIIKIDKKMKKVVSEWGDGMKNGDGFFSKQHGLDLLRDGSVAVFSNGDREPPAGQKTPLYSSIVNFSQPSNNQKSKVTWQFDCVLDSVNYQSLRGGNVDELNNGNLLLCMGAVNRVIEVSRTKKVVWSAIIERKGRKNEGWIRLPLNMAHYTSSLYPYYFTIQNYTDTLWGNDKVYRLRIFNDGSEEDSYNISINSSLGNIYKSQSPVILSHSSLTIDLPADSIRGKGEKMVVTVQSKTNTEMLRSLYVQVISR